MLNALVHNTGLDGVLDATISIDSKKVFKPSPAAYSLIEARLAVSPADVLFVSCNPFDVCGAKSFGRQVAWIEHVPPEAMVSELADRERPGRGDAVGVAGVGQHVCDRDPVAADAFKDGHDRGGRVEMAGGEVHPSHQLWHGRGVMIGDYFVTQAGSPATLRCRKQTVGHSAWAYS